MSAPKPFDGTAVILHLIEAARAWQNAVVRELGSSGAHPLPEEQELDRWIDVLEARYQREKIEPEPVGWHPRRWCEVTAGDRVSLRGVEADVIRCITHHWHVDPEKREWHEGPDADYCRTCQQRCLKRKGWKNFPLEHDVTEVSLLLPGETEPRTYPRMLPDGEVEVLRGPAGRALDEVNGFRSELQEEPINVMQSWAADAAVTLEAAGLGPVEMVTAPYPSGGEA